VYAMLVSKEKIAMWLCKASFLTPSFFKYCEVFADVV
jgi:hypothetical protein